MGLTGIAPVIGAISMVNYGQISIFGLFILFIIGCLSHVFGFVLNDILDIKIDKISNIDKKRIITFFMENAKYYRIDIINLDDYYNNQNETKIPYLEFSALKKTNLGKLNHFINQYFSKKNKSLGYT